MEPGAQSCDPYAHPCWISRLYRFPAMLLILITRVNFSYSDCGSTFTCIQAIVDVDEQGTVASAATAMTMNRCVAVDQEPPVLIVFDRPFIFSIVHSPSSTPVFSGAVRAPAEVPKLSSFQDPAEVQGGSPRGCCGRWGV